MISFPSGGCVDDVVNIQTNYCFTSVIAIHFMNGAGACWVIRRTVFNVYICLNHSPSYKHNKLEKCHEKPRHVKAVFSEFR